METFILPPREIIKEIIRFSTFPAKRIHYLSLCLVCKEWNEYIQFLVSEKHRIELPELAVTWAVQDLIHLFQYSLSKSRGSETFNRVGFTLSTINFFYEYYTNYNTDLRMNHKCTTNEPTELCKMRKELWSCDESITIQETEAVSWLEKWLPKFIFQHDDSTFSCDNRYQVNTEIDKIYLKYIDSACCDELFSFRCLEFLNIIEATPLHKFRKLLFQ